MPHFYRKIYTSNYYQRVILGSNNGDWLCKCLKRYLLLTVAFGILIDLLFTMLNFGGTLYEKIEVELNSIPRNE